MIVLSVRSGVRSYVRVHPVLKTGGERTRERERNGTERREGRPTGDQVGGWMAGLSWSVVSGPGLSCRVRPSRVASGRSRLVLSGVVASGPVASGRSSPVGRVGSRRVRCSRCLGQSGLGGRCRALSCPVLSSPVTSSQARPGRSCRGSRVGAAVVTARGRRRN